MVAEDEQRGLRLVLEFDGVWWHGRKHSARRDAAKAERLRAAGWTVVRIRESGLQKLDATFDVVIGSAVAADDAASEVLEHLVRLGLVDATDAAAYRSDELPRAAAVADHWIQQELGKTALLDDRRNQETAWKRMHTAWVSFEARFGHCRMPKGILVEGVDVARWIVKQRSLHRRGAIPPERRELLKSIPSWSFAPRDVNFAEQVDLFVERWTARPLTSDERSQSSTWATNLRMRREALQAKGTDYSAERLAAMDALPGWQWDPRGAEFGRKVDVLKAHVDQTGRSVAQIKQRVTWNGKPLGAWLNTWRTHPDRLSPEQRRLLEELPGWTWKQRDDGWDARLAQLKVFATEDGHARPSVNSADEDEQALARWKRNNKNRRRGRSDPRTAQLRKLLARYGETL